GRLFFLDIFLPGSRARFRLFFLTEVLVGVANRWALLFSHFSGSPSAPNLSCLRIYSAPKRSSPRLSICQSEDDLPKQRCLAFWRTSARLLNRSFAGTMQRSGRDQVLGRGLASPAIRYDLIRDLLTLVEAVHSGPLDGADVDEHVVAAIVRLDESEALLAVEPLHGSLGHLRCLLSMW